MYIHYNLFAAKSNYYFILHFMAIYVLQTPFDNGEYKMFLLICVYNCLFQVQCTITFLYQIQRLIFENISWLNNKWKITEKPKPNSTL